MPVQRTLFGRLLNIRLPPRRWLVLILFNILIIVFIPLYYRFPTEIENGAERVAGRIKDIPDTILLPVHKPPVQSNSTYGKSSWFSDWSWRHPFSSSVTKDEDRTVLPPLTKRPFVYTYYEPKKHVAKDILSSEEKLLLVWRRAWWAQGFWPVVLGKAEALRNPLYKKMELLKIRPNKNADKSAHQALEESLKYELLRWLAWGHMGTGVLVNWLTLPMAHWDDPLLTFLRGGVYPQVTHYTNLGNNMFCGEKAALNTLLKSILDKPDDLRKSKSVIDAIERPRYSIDSQHESIALYDLDSIQKNYKPIADLMQGNSTEGEGLRQLADLMNSHLHTNWLNNFPEGIAILKPLRHMTVLLEPAIQIAESLQQCSSSPMPESCPPNRDCKPCSAENRKVVMISAYTNRTDQFSIGAVPHPYTATTLGTWKKRLTIHQIRRETKRDMWLNTVTAQMLDADVGSSRRIVAFKDVVAAEAGSRHSLWVTAEPESHKDLNWIFGFGLPVIDTNATAMNAEEPGSALVEASNGTVPKPGEPREKALKQERDMLRTARAALDSEDEETVAIREAVEAWNMADTEVWKFARAFSSRRRVERLKWEEGERSFAGAEEGNPSRWW